MPVGWELLRPWYRENKANKNQAAFIYIYILWKDEVKTLLCFATSIVALLQKWGRPRQLDSYLFHFHNWKKKILNKQQSKNWKCRFFSVRTGRINDTIWKCVRAPPIWVQTTGSQESGCIKNLTLQEHRRKTNNRMRVGSGSHGKKAEGKLSCFPRSWEVRHSLEDTWMDTWWAS